MIWTLLFLTVGGILTISWFVKPKHVGIRFTRSPPVVARVNTPRDDASEQSRRIELPTGDSYTIPVGIRGHFILVFDWSVPVHFESVSSTVTIPKLSTTDFASIPRPLHSLLSPLNNTIYAAILHDYLYRDPKDAFSASLDRATIDRMFYWGMRARGVKRITAGLMYLGVRLGGSSSYKRISPTA